MKKIFRTSIFALIGSLLILGSCKDDTSYKLQWKLNNDMAYYKTDINLSDLKFSMPGSKSESKPQKSSLPKNSDIEHYLILSGKSAPVSYRVLSHKKETTDNKPINLSMASFMAISVNDAEGTVDASGNAVKRKGPSYIENLVSILFQFPDNEIMVGDKWPIKADFLGMDTQKLSGLKITDEKNNANAKLIDTKIKNGHTILLIEYDILNYLKGDLTALSDMTVETQMNVKAGGILEFDVSEGRMIKLAGHYSMTSTNMWNTQMDIKIDISKVDELPADVKQKINGNKTITANTLKKIGSTKTVKITDESKSNIATEEIKSEQIQKNKTKPRNTSGNTSEKRPDCPVKFGVQILSSSEKKSLDADYFKTVKGRVYIRVKENDAAKYKYIVGNECSREAADKIKAELKTKGYKDAFIVKIDK